MERKEKEKGDCDSECVERTKGDVRTKRVRDDCPNGRTKLDKLVCHSYSFDIDECPFKVKI